MRPLFRDMFERNENLKRKMKHDLGIDVKTTIFIRINPVGSCKIRPHLKKVSQKVMIGEKSTN